MAKKPTKTNAMRMLDKEKIAYELREYPDSIVGALKVANYLGQPTHKLFKTLVTTDNKKGYYVFCLPSDEELDLKAAAKCAGVKKIEMLKQKDLLPLTGYVHGGCSPVGMKKLFPTVMDVAALDLDTIYMSGGKIGLQIEIEPEKLVDLIGLRFEKITK